MSIQATLSHLKLPIRTMIKGASRMVNGVHNNLSCISRPYHLAHFQFCAQIIMSVAMILHCHVSHLHTHGISEFRVRDGFLDSEVAKDDSEQRRYI
jgi:hypothetical protein